MLRYSNQKLIIIKILSNFTKSKEPIIQKTNHQILNNLNNKFNPI